MNSLRPHTRSLRADIRRLAGTMPATDLARQLGVPYGSLRAYASKDRVSLRCPERDGDAERPGADDYAVARLDARRGASIELNGIILTAEVAAKLTQEATARGTSLKGLVARLVSVIAADSLVAAVLDVR